MINLRRLMLLPLGISAGYLVAVVFYEDIDYFFTTSPFQMLPIVLALLMPACFALANRISNKNNQELFRLTVLSPCATAPMAVFYPWAAVPGGLGMGYAGFPSFLEWITKYPNVGPFNIEVFLGTCCVILAYFLPAIFAYFHLETNQMLTKKIVVLLAIEFVALLAVLVKLDWLLLLGGLVGSVGLDGETRIRELYAVVGPLFRLMAMTTMVLLVIKSFIQMTRSNKGLHRTKPSSWRLCRSEGISFKVAECYTK